MDWNSETLVVIFQVIVALGIVNVWILRFNKSTTYRGGSAESMKEEFEAYGLSETIMKLVGFFKLSFAALLIVGIWYPIVVVPAAAGMSLLMIGALLMHVKIGDEPIKSLPALLMLVMCGFIVFMA
ncbi:MAG: DoxX family protein [Balneolia bacterium]|nr:DoxX family protein [Balneolia bacterium]